MTGGLPDVPTDSPLHSNVIRVARAPATIWVFVCCFENPIRVDPSRFWQTGSNIGLIGNDGALKAAGTGRSAHANQVPVERPLFAYIGQSGCQAPSRCKYGRFALFLRKMRCGQVSGECIAPRRTTALREAANYGLRGWISTRSNDPARILQRFISRPLSGCGSCSIVSLLAGMLRGPKS